MALHKNTQKCRQMLGFWPSLVRANMCPKYKTNLLGDQHVTGETRLESGGRMTVLGGLPSPSTDLFYFTADVRSCHGDIRSIG